MAHDKAYTFVAALLRRSKNRTATNLDHYAKRTVYLRCRMEDVIRATACEFGKCRGGVEKVAVFST